MNDMSDIKGWLGAIFVVVLLGAIFIICLMKWEQNHSKEESRFFDRVERELIHIRGNSADKTPPTPAEPTAATLRTRRVREGESLCALVGGRYAPTGEVKFCVIHR